MFEGMFTIGELASIAGISTQTLRYYDRIGLFKPAVINPGNDYRYYYQHQLMMLSVINSLKNCGLSLSNIKQCINQDDLTHIPNILLEQKNNIRKEIEMLNLKEEQLDYHIQNIKLGLNCACDFTIEIKKIPAREVVFLSLHDTVGIEPVILNVNILKKIANKNGWTVFGKPIIIYTSITGKNIKSPINLDVCFRVKHKSGSSKYLRVIPAGDYAYLFHKGSYENFFESFCILYDWIEANNYLAIGNPIIVIIIDIPMTKSVSNLISEIQIPVRKI